MLDDMFEMLDCLLVLVELVQDLGEAEVGGNALRLQLHAVTEILLCFLELTLICQLRSQVNGCAEMRLVLQEHLLEVIYGLLEFLVSLILATKVEMRLQLSLFELTRDSHLQA